MTTDLREGLALALVNNDRTRQGWTNARWVDFDEPTQLDYLANADCALAFIRAHDGHADCKCDLRTRLVGDGCEICNPAKALEYAKETISDLRDGHTEFVRAVRNAAQSDGFPNSALQTIRELCAVELEKESSNG